MPPRFISFDDAWRWFSDGGDPVPVAEQRERFTAGRAQFIAFQTPLGGLPVADAIEALQDELADIGGIELMPRDALHISVRGVGFQVIAKTRPDDVARAEVPRIGERAAAVFAATPPIDAVLGPLNVLTEAVIVEVHDGGRLGELRARLDAAAPGDALAPDASGYLPHATVAWFRDASGAAELRRRLAALRERVLPPVQLRRVELARWWFTGDDPAATPDRETLRSYLLSG
ncbi:MAG TPA: 2'-5' RNA ligase family protein [Dehalococcoidia bacterium]|nr:2'-5' RNA ligase family protein [Dehalococcoidia bacterium]